MFFGYQLKALLGIFAVILIANLLIAAALLSTGVEGEFLPNAAWNTFLGFFGGFGSLLSILGALAVLAIAYFGTVFLSRKGRHNLVGVIVLVAILLGGFLLWKWFDWNILTQFSWSVIWLIVFTIAETLVVLVVFNSLNTRRQETVAAPTV